MLEEICILFLIGSQLSYAMTSTSCSIVMNSIQQGFHRKLTTSVVLTFPPKSILKKSQCMVVLKEIFPGDIYIDPYQVHRLKGIQITFQSKVNIEKPEFLSPQQQFLAYIPLLKSSNVGHLVGELNLPYHVRYHRPKTGDNSHATINLESPRQLFTNCSDGLGELEKMPCSSSDSSMCLWQKFNCKASRMTINIPVGDLNRLIPVTVITMLSTFASTTTLLNELFKQHKA